MTETRAFRDGTVVRRGPGWCITRLPCGRVVRARPNADSATSAKALGYGSDVAALTHDHDYLHALLCDAIGLPSHSLRMAAGLKHDAALAALEEAAVLATQRWARAVLCRDAGRVEGVEVAPRRGD